MQSQIDTWCQGLHFMGGGLKEVKCYSYLQAYNWKGGQWQYSKISTLNLPPLTVQHDDNERYPIKLHDVDEATEYLGCMTRPDGGMKEQLNVIEGKVKTWATNTSASALD